ncbi:hypothetical protein BCR37DRAFT_383920 [Protomyces lactucae-debilis]|uniref:Uncharacterized protein n=1 Tax=Protomyces lactucae-debilis TaxID=2754530 RepID=A0A1Y2EYC0_PROLT|nr:uncharacterized protein BCR37DRAFT_383920 [Protomyces lactucae-debilis]ORY75785.1 hypothetical protein BCR37DRAFT_383920 [Protomyces lactucae-debilis]
MIVSARWSCTAVSMNSMPPQGLLVKQDYARPFKAMDFTVYDGCASPSIRGVLGSIRMDNWVVACCITLVSLLLPQCNCANDY